ncbi:MAG TPA: hypothetical protein VHE59_10505 [Mucilaginibacter sp.]|nr:hypothetical protein [Mucilaginibacter sp.]
MANLVEFLVKIKDMASGPLQKIAGSGGNAFQKLENSINKVTGKTSGLKMNLSQIDVALRNLEKTRSISFDDRQIRRINREMSDLQKQKDRLEGGGSKFGMGGLLRQGLAIAGIGSFAFLGGSIMSKGIDRQISQISLETLVGKKAGDQLNDRLVDYAQKSIYGNEIMGEGKLLAGSGVKANNIMPIMHMLGDLGMGDAERMKTLALAFSEANSTGYLTGRQEMMMRTALFNPLEALASITHKSGAQIKKDMEKGKVGIDMLVQAMEYATGPMGRWHNMEDKIAGSGAGKWIAFKGALTTLAGTIGMALMPALGGLSNLLNTLINNKPLLIDIAWAIGAMTVAWTAYTVVTNWAAISAAALEVAAMWPLALVGLVAGAISALCSQNNQLAGNTQSNMSTIGGAFTGIRRVVEMLVYWIEYAILTIENLWESLTLIGNGMIDIATGNFKKGWDEIMHTKTDAYMKRQQLVLNREWHLADDYGGGNNKTALGLAPLGNDKYTPTGAGAGNTIDAGDTTASITGGGVRSITINVAKFQDKTEIHTTTIKEGAQQVEEIFRDMFLRIVNSGAVALN